MKAHWPIRTQLALLVLAVAAPIAGLLVYTTYTHFQEDLHEAAHSALSLAQITAADTSSYLQNRQTVLVRIAERPLIRALDPQRCDPILLDFRDLDSNFSNVVVLDREGQVICSAIPTPAEKTVNYANGENFQRVLRENRFVVGKVSFGRISNKWILPLAHPIHDYSGKLSGVLGAAIDLVRYLPVASASALSAGTTVTLVSSMGIVLARFPDPEKWVGTSMSQTEIFRMVLAQREEHAPLAGMTRGKQVYGFSPVPGSDWFALVGIPTDTVLANALAVAWRDGALSLLFLLTAVALAYLVARRIEGPVTAIAQAAKAVADGALDVRLAAEGPVEIVGVAQQFNRMLEVRQQTESSLRRSTEHMALAMDAARMGTWEWDIKRDQVAWAESTGGLFGMRAGEVLDNYAAFLASMHPDDRSTVQRAVDLTLKSGAPFAAEFRVVWRDGSAHWLAGRGQLIRDAAGEPERLIGVAMDIAERMRSDEHMRYLATHDPLTGLINRREFENRLEAALTRARSLNNQHALLYLDLDQFKVVNDTSGHVAGDELLRQLSSLLAARVRDTDILARLGGDEFGVLLENCPLENARQLAEDLRQTVLDFRFAWKDKGFAVGVSIGLVPITDNSLDPEQAMSAADAACFLAKDRGRNRVHVHHAGDSAVHQHQREMEWVARIHRAFAESRFRLFFQPIIPLGAHEEGLHCELLVRMLRVDGAVIPPMAFLPAAERYGMMPSIDRWVIEAAFQTFDRRHRQGRGPDIHTCAINLSATSLNDEAFLDFVREQFIAYRVSPQTICFEVTETAAVANLVQVRRFIKELKALGCRFALDDFGSGMSSFTYLKNLAVDYLKIDGSFVRDMVRDPIDLAMVQAINNIGHVMGIKTVAEFVESDAVLNQLRQLGVDYAQGYGIAQPAPIEDLGREAPQLSVVGAAPV